MVVQQSPQVSTLIGDEGNVVASFKDLDGNVVADSHDKWLEWAKSDPDMSNHLGGNKASGTDYSTVSPSSNSQDKNDYSKMSNDDKLSYLENVQLK